MWQRLMEWLPDLAVGTIEIRDIANLIVASVGTYLAWLAIRMGREQDAVTAKQLTLAEEMNGLLSRLTELETTQASILEQQQRMVDRELSKRALLKLVVPNPATPRQNEPTQYAVFMLNEGEKAEGGYWYLGVPKYLGARIKFEPAPGNERVLVAADNWGVTGAFDQPKVSCFADDFYLVKFRSVVPLEPGVMTPCGIITVQWLSQPAVSGDSTDEIRNPARRYLLWFTNGPSGRFPSEGMKKLRLYGPTEGWFKPQFGGIEPAQDDPTTSSSVRPSRAAV